jgi:hypothetical protein
MLGLNREPDPRLRDIALREWARCEARSWEGLTWFESTAAASGWLTVLALLALAVERGEPEESRVRASTRDLAAAGGSLSRLLLPVLRTWRVLYSQRDE